MKVNGSSQPVSELRRKNAALLTAEVVPAVNQLLVNDQVSQKKITDLERRLQIVHRHIESLEQRFNVSQFDVAVFSGKTWRQRLAWILWGL